MDTIFAEATPPGRGGISIVRLSGPAAFEIAASLGAAVAPRRPALRDIRDGSDVIDRALIIGFAGGESFTGEPVVEFQLHGAPVVVRRLSQALSARGARQAGAGEFTKRAFLGGRLDLTEVQGLSDLLVAETEAQRQLAMRNASGELGRLAEKWRAALIRAGALVMASLDFPDEETPEEVPAEALSLIEELRGEIKHALRGAAGAEMLREGFSVAVIGPPNAGKSSFLNRVAKRDVALVTDIPGTTRDALEVRIDLDGMPVTLIDTAGLRQSDDRIEQMGIEVARRRASEASLRLHLSEDGLGEQELWRDGDIAVRTKADLRGDGVGISAVTGKGVDDILAEIRRVLADRVADAGIVSHASQADQLRTAARALDQAGHVPAEVLAEQIREALRALEALVGRVDMDEYLDVVFSAFCIGK